jgi:hypothetical protein
MIHKRFYSACWISNATITTDKYGNEWTSFPGGDSHMYAVELINRPDTKMESNLQH